MPIEQSSRLVRIEDEDAIRRLVALYSDAVTHLDAARAASIYTEDGCASIAGNHITGRSAIEDGMRRTFSAFSLLQLIAHGGIIEIDGDWASARWSTIELAVRRQSTDLNCIFGRYEDQLVRRPEGWRFKRRSFTMAGRALIETTKLQHNADFAALLGVGQNPLALGS
jgi:ketosteroid isomerase-like protein